MTDEDASGNPNSEEEQGREEVEREIAEPAVDRQDGRRRYFQIRTQNPLFYRDEQLIR